MAGPTLGDLAQIVRTELDPDVGEAVRLVGDTMVVPTDVVSDSRAVNPGALFAAIVGSTHDGHDHAGAALAAGAGAFLVERELNDDDLRTVGIARDIPQLIVPTVRRVVGPVAAEVAGRPSDDLTVIGVTGTNGKTTVVTLLDQLLTQLGAATGTIGTLTGERTTPEATELQHRLARFRTDGVTHVAMEVSSHALDMSRVRGTRFAAAIFTNLGQDHLDYHRTPERYMAAKAELFTPSYTRLAIVNRDDVRGRLLIDAASVLTVGYGLDDADDLRWDSSGVEFIWRGHDVRLPLLGRHNVSNALAAATTLVELGYPSPAIAAALGSVTAPRGRLEVVSSNVDGVGVVVDYAHTPDALEAALDAARAAAGSGAVRLVMGCGGDRDGDKRPLIGAVAERFADWVAVTNDNPRSEDPQRIANAIIAGMSSPPALLELDRATAIARAIGGADPGDIVLIAGKGHETTQTIGDSVVPFDDVAVARTVLGEDTPAAGSVS